jgi:hypothetical protein
MLTLSCNKGTIEVAKDNASFIQMMLKTQEHRGRTRLDVFDLGLDGRKFNWAPGCHMLPLSKKIFHNVKKIQLNSLHLYIHNLKVFVKFRRKLIFLWSM